MLATDQHETASGSLHSRLIAEAGKLFQVREFNVLIALVVVGVLISLYTPYFFTTNNLMGVFRAFSLTATMTIPMLMIA
ncbi:MAG: hypothetical protein QMD99_25850, partial [Rhizobiaceae bacterium]|nr:hypothetical protein [Rhizobiaceae bacterium]